MLKGLFWISGGLILFTHAGYAVVLHLLRLLGLGRRSPGVAGAAAGSADAPPSGSAPPEPATARPSSNDDDEDDAAPIVSLIIAAYDEEEVIAAKVENALSLDYPRRKLEVIVASDGSGDRTVSAAGAAGADHVLDLPRQGKSLTQNAAAAQASGEILAFSDSNSFWHPDALRRLVEAFDDLEVAYACGQVAFASPDGDNQEGLYWRYEMAVRSLESDFAGVTAGNGGIYAVRRDDYIPLGAAGSHDLSLPFLLAKRGRRSVYVPAARAEERMVPSLEGEWSRKRRMMIGIWDIVVGEGMVRPHGYSPAYAFEVYGHRVARYLTPALHIALAVATLGLLGRGRTYRAALALQVAILAGAALADRVPAAPLRVCRYYVLMTAAIAAGLWDRWRGGPPAGAWEKSEGTR